ncbi:flagellar FlbD family protein [Anaerosporobacter sp.]|uniref:flagellar FlbD family protein n=1 Tax=Anaerosporobacter sp. TaxID=1872529 RepID=UPI00286F3D4F|nr:flagellar FlbD family protein [Anaerosporobacter sp.]
MIELTRLNGVRFSVNCDLIETVEETPDTVITLTNGRKFVVAESMGQLRSLVIDFKKQIYSNVI